jgi:hypothetical protein
MFNHWGFENLAALRMLIKVNGQSVAPIQDAAKEAGK